MSLKALFYAYVLGGLTFLPLLILAAIFYTIYTSVPVGDPDPNKLSKRELERRDQPDAPDPPSTTSAATPPDVNDLPKPRKGWLTVRRTFEESQIDSSYVDMVRGFLDSRSKDPKRPKDTWYVALKGKVLYLYEDESMTECEAAIELSGHDVVIYPEGLPDGELYAKRNAICLKPKASAVGKEMPSVTREMMLGELSIDELVEEKGGNARQKQQERERLAELEKRREEARELAMNTSTPWFIFVRSVVEMEDWYLALVHASDNPANSPTLDPLKPVFKPEDMAHLVATLDEQPDVIPMRWLNALIGRIFFSYYRTQTLESYIIGRLMKKLSKIKRPGFLTDIKVREVSVGNRAPTFSKPMLKELTKEGDASLEVHLAYKGEVRITVEATATINLGARFKTYVVKLVLALVVREIEGNLLVKVKRPPSSRIWYAFTQMPRIVLDVEPVVSDRQITWSMILSTIESKVKEAIYESVVMPNMDDISFFESAQYHHRGGIWADASRSERAPTLDGEQPSSTDGTGTPSTSPAEDAQVTPLPRSHSAEEVENIGGPGTLPEPEPMARSTTVGAATPAGLGTSPGTKRRTWFSSGQEEPDVFANAPSNPAISDNHVSRGRTLSHDAKTERRSSLPASVNSTEDSPQRVDDRDIEGDGQYLSPTPQGRRSISASSRAASVSSSRGGDISDDSSDAHMATYRSKSPAPPGSSPRQTPSSPAGASFFQTLKSRADKQALSNTAKETMRKWGVNWGNFRRETLGSSGSASGGVGSADEGVPDAGHGDQRRIDSRTSVVRPSYAELRAAVEERRERERAPLQEASSRSNTPASVPIPMPQNGKGKERAESVSPGHASTLLGVSPTAKSDASAMPRSESPVPLERTVSQASGSSHPSATHALGMTPDEPERPSSPIHTQPPPPKTMTIPGIHASHRGDVMSMGYAPPPPPADQQDQKKAPLQSVYRLWKNPGNANTSTPRSEPATVSQTGFTGRDQDSAQPTSEEGEPTAQPPRPPPGSIPPPLPPRANPTHVLHSKPEVARLSETDTSSLSKASAALQSIASKDRVKRASLTPPTSIPSSPGQDSNMPSGTASLDCAADALDAAASPASITPTPSSPPSLPPPQGPNGRGPPPALPPRRQRTAS
ncbi:hypothetical protein L227DRAFT_494352 [Lentinus tigrinus ALCF2SS1-6]|uniref:SMP-LTD domain-containing protein n=1 Tax=Lentinus tigrinus ALCF2SS1-6 TaxID=1328759 RepID=A0A5C2SP20_9APHY|nr:hypothetical protein L227DRAFT_494352 [Lentinus tigrinus ALCF2SS1-6]